MASSRTDDSVRACLYHSCGHVGTDVIERAASDVGEIFYQGPMCSVHAAQLRRDDLLIVEDFVEDAPAAAAA